MRDRQYYIIMDMLDTVISSIHYTQPVKGMDWIEKLIFYKDDLLVLGFHTVGGVLFIVPCIL